MLFLNAFAQNNQSNDNNSNQLAFYKECYSRGNRLNNDKCNDWQKRLDAEIQTEEKKLLEECKSSYSDFNKIKKETLNACSKASLGLDSCNQKVNECEQKSSQERRSSRLSITNPRNNETKLDACSLTALKNFGSLEKKVKIYDEKANRAKEELKDAKSEILNKVKEQESLQTDLTEARSAIEDFLRESKVRLEQQFNNQQKSAAAIENDIHDARQIVSNFNDDTQLRVTEFDEKIEEIEAKCGQVAANEFKQQEIEYQKNISQQATSGQYKTNGFGLFFGRVTPKRNNTKNVDYQMRKKWLNYLKANCTLSDTTKLQRKKLERAKEQAKQALEKAKTEADRTILAKQKELKQVLANAPEELKNFHAKEASLLKALQDKEASILSQLNRLSAELVELQKNQRQATKDMANSQRLQQTLEEAIGDKQAEVQADGIDTEVTREDITDLFSNMRAFNEKQAEAHGICQCAKATTPPQNISKCGQLQPLDGRQTRTQKNTLQRGDSAQ